MEKVFKENIDFLLALAEFCFVILKFQAGFSRSDGSLSFSILENTRPVASY